MNIIQNSKDLRLLFRLSFTHVSSLLFLSWLITQGLTGKYCNAVIGCHNVTE